MNPRAAQWRTAAVVLLVALFGVISGTELGNGFAESAHPHRASALSAVSVLTPVIADHPHARDGSHHPAPELVATASMPRPSTTLMAAGLALAVIVTVAFWRKIGLNPVRGPPPTVSPVHSGRVILTRLCISRR
ncbi:hypothetical protein ABIA30_000696 [Mycobacterium sp. MAA66]|uniref:hypothetical protein n=1 Tax=Mycobacterium sp. MAA66 TaxID=3156297 RepID=UPI0035198E28